MSELLQNVNVSPILLADTDAEPVEVQEVTGGALQQIRDLSFLQRYCFPVVERTVRYSLDNESIDSRLTSNYKSIVRVDNDKLISIMKKTYRVIPNAQVIHGVMNELSKIDARWEIDPSHSFVSDERMKLQIKFPDLRLHDGDSEIPLSVFIHNSYDGSEGVRILWGAIRAICSNGMIFGKVFGKYYHRHTRNASIGSIRKQLERSIELLPIAQTRIEHLICDHDTESLLPSIKKYLGSTIHDYVVNSGNAVSGCSQWDVLNTITYYISHTIDQRMRTYYQLQTSKIFGI